MKSNPTQIASQIAEVVISKGVSFAGFDYNGTRRNVTVGKKRNPNPLAKKTSWGKTFAKGALVAYDGKLFLQGEENNHGEGELKRFNLAKVENFVIG